LSLPLVRSGSLPPLRTYLSRVITRRSWAGSHIPRPVAVGTPRLLSTIAIPYHDVTPPRRISATMGASLAARASARATRALRPASPVFDFPVTSMASRGKERTRARGRESARCLCGTRIKSSLGLRSVSRNWRLSVMAVAIRSILQGFSGK
jgi:hypothetical protein